MRKIMPFIVIGIGLILISVSASVVLLDQQGSELTSSVSEPDNCVVPEPVEFPAPQLTLIDIENNPVSLSDHLGTVVLINAWATWCPPCKAEMPDLQEYYDLHADDGFVIIGVNIGESVDRVLEFSEAFDISFPLWLDQNEETLRAMNTTAMPSSYVIDRSGTVRLAWSGLTCLSALESTVTPIIEE